jgi:hypothetical protein
MAICILIFFLILGVVSGNFKEVKSLLDSFPDGIDLAKLRSSEPTSAEFAKALDQLVTNIRSANLTNRQTTALQHAAVELENFYNQVYQEGKNFAEQLPLLPADERKKQLQDIKDGYPEVKMVITKMRALTIAIFEKLNRDVPAVVYDALDPVNKILNRTRNLILICVGVAAAVLLGLALLFHCKRSPATS